MNGMSGNIVTLFENGGKKDFIAAITALGLDPAHIKHAEDAEHLADILDSFIAGKSVVVTDSEHEDAVIYAGASDANLVLVAEAPVGHDGASIIHPATLRSGLEKVAIADYFPSVVTPEFANLPSEITAQIAMVYLQKQASDADPRELAEGVNRFQGDYGAIGGMRIAGRLLQGNSRCKIFTERKMIVDGREIPEHPRGRSMRELVDKNRIKKWGLFAYACGIMGNLNEPNPATNKSLTKLEAAYSNLKMYREALMKSLAPLRGRGYRIKP